MNWLRPVSSSFSPGALIVTKVPGLETQKAFEATGAVPITRMSRAFAADQPVVVLNARTKERHMVWAEIDSTASAAGDVTLLIRPGVNFDEGERYIVALRNLKDARGHTIKAQPAFRALRDRKRDPQIEGRRVAVARTRQARRKGLSPVGILDSSRYASLHPGYYVVFQGVYDSEPEAWAVPGPFLGLRLIDLRVGEHGREVVEQLQCLEPDELLLLLLRHYYNQ